MAGLLSGAIKMVTKPLVKLAATAGIGYVGYKYAEKEGYVDAVTETFDGVKETVNDGIEFVEETIDTDLNMDGKVGQQTNSSPQGAGDSPASSQGGSNTVVANNLDNLFPDLNRAGLEVADGYNLQRATTADGSPILDDNGFAQLWYEKDGMVMTKDGPKDPNNVTEERFFSNEFKGYGVNSGMSPTDLNTATANVRQQQNQERQQREQEEGQSDSLIDRAKNWIQDNPIMSLLGLGTAGAGAASLFGKGGGGIFKTLLIVTGIAFVANKFMGNNSSNSTDNSISSDMQSAGIYNSPDGTSAVMTDELFDQKREELFNKHMKNAEEMYDNGKGIISKDEYLKLKAEIIAIDKGIKYEKTMQDMGAEYGALANSEGLSQEARIRILENATNAQPGDVRENKYERHVEGSAQDARRQEAREQRDVDRDNRPEERLTRRERRDTENDLQDAAKEQGRRMEIVHKANGDDGKPQTRGEFRREAKAAAADAKAAMLDDTIETANRLQAKVAQGASTGKIDDPATTLRDIQTTMDDLKNQMKDTPREMRDAVRRELKQLKQAEKVLSRAA